MGLLEVSFIFLACVLVVAFISIGSYGIFRLFNPPKFVPTYDPHMQVPSSKLSITDRPMNPVIKDKKFGLDVIAEEDEEPESTSALSLQGG